MSYWKMIVSLPHIRLDNHVLLSCVLITIAHIFSFFGD